MTCKTSKLENPAGGPDYEKIAKLREKYDQIQKEAEELDQEVTKMGNNPAMEKKRQELEAIRLEYGRLMADMQGHPLTDQFRSQSLQSLNPQVENLNNGLDRSGQKIKWNTKLTEAWDKTMARLKSRVMFSIVSMLNPIRVIRQAWSGFLEQNVKTKNTLKMIGLNLQKVIAPLLQKIVDFIFRMAQYANVLTKAWFNVDLFDKSVLSAQQTQKEIKKINQLTAGFDELNVFNGDSNNTDNGPEILDTSNLPKVDTSKLENWAKNGLGKTLGDTLSWSLEHPLETVGIMLGAKFAAGLLGKGLGALVKKGIGKIFGGEEVVREAVTVGKLLGGITLTAGGTALAISQAADAGKNWQDLTTSAKVGKVALSGLGSAAAGLGAIMLGASGPVGWAVAGAVALTSFVVGMGQVQDGIGSVKKETKRLGEAQANAKIANDNYLISMNNLAITTANLEQIERETGLSGESLAEQVESGILTIDNMTSAQLRCYNAYLQNEEMIKQNKKAIEEKAEADKQEVIQSLRVEIANAKKSGSYDELKRHIVEAYEKGELSAEECRGITERAMGGMSKASRETFMEDLPKDIREGLDPTKYATGFEGFANNFKTWMNNIGSWFKQKWQGIKNWWNSLWGNNYENFSAGGGQGGRWPVVEEVVLVLQLWPLEQIMFLMMD